MYEELVNTLLYDAGWLEQGMTQTEHDIAEHLKKAADAIEELSRLAEVNAKRAMKWAADAEKAQRWIPVTQPPKEDGWYQVYAPGYSGGSSSGLKNIRGNMYSAFKNGKWSIEVGYHKRPGCVKAWMPLPEPPKEEE